MSRIKYQQAAGKPRGRGYFPQLEGLARKIGEITSTPGPAPDVRLTSDHEARLSAREAKLARRAKQAKRAGLVP